MNTACPIRFSAASGFIGSLRAISETLRHRGFWFKTRRGCAVLLPVRQENTTLYCAKNTLSPVGLRPKMPTTVLQILVRTWAITCDPRLVVNILASNSALSEMALRLLDRSLSKCSYGYTFSNDQPNYFASHSGNSGSYGILLGIWLFVNYPGLP